MNNRYDRACLTLALIVTLIIIVAAINIALGISTAGAESILYAAVSEGSSLNGRAEPDKHSERCASYAAGDELTVISYQDGWYEVVGSEYGTCWVSADYVSDTPQTGEKAAKIVSNGRVALRDKPDGERVGWLHNGDSVTLYATADGWAHITGGWVMEEYVE
ncbi:MAG: SH3 domain-containing protein [Eubacteriales bacterium]|nr:SH3 domain-containing protein [Eubacteriales bacterium]